MPDAGGVGEAVHGDDLATIWQTVLDRLAGKVGDVSYRAWLAPTTLCSLSADTAVVTVPHALAQRWIAGHLLDGMREELAAVTARERAIRLDIAGAAPAAIVTPSAPRRASGVRRPHPVAGA